MVRFAAAMWPRSRTARLILWSALIAGLACRVYVMFTDAGIYWPDDIDLSLEPAHRLVFGYGLIAWEFSEGARNWAFPGLIAGLMSATAGLGGDSPQIYLPVIRLVFIAMSLGVALGIDRLCLDSERIRGIRGCRRGGLGFGGALDLLCPPRHERERRDGRGGLGRGLPVGAASLSFFPRLAGRVVARLVGLVPHSDGRVRDWRARRPCSAQELARPARDSRSARRLGRRVRRPRCACLERRAGARRMAAGFTPRILDVRFTLIEGRAAEWGTSPPGYYAEFIFRSMPIIAGCLAIGLVAGLRYATALSGLALLFLVGHSAIPHKEFRFILPMLPLAVAATVTSFDALPRARRDWPALDYCSLALSSQQSRFRP